MNSIITIKEKPVEITFSIEFNAKGLLTLIFESKGENWLTDKLNKITEFHNRGGMIGVTNGVKVRRVYFIENLEE